VKLYCVLLTTCIINKYVYVTEPCATSVINEVYFQHRSKVVKYSYLFCCEICLLKLVAFHQLYNITQMCNSFNHCLSLLLLDFIV